VGDQRSYFKRRTFQEFRQSAIADCSEASLAHVRLAQLQLKRCQACTVEKTEECHDCPVAILCDEDRRFRARRLLKAS
jgi:hypothetical protein